MNILFGLLEQGLIFGILSLGLYITYSILNFPDLSVDGTFPLGGAISTYFILRGYGGEIALLMAIIAGGIAGLITGLIHVKLKVKDLLSGIIVMTGLYTINLFIAGKSNVPVFNERTIFNGEGPMSLSFLGRYKMLFVVLILALIFKIALDLYLKTKSGYLLKATGNNPILVKLLGKNPDNTKILGLVMANALVCAAGAVMMQHQRFFEISMGTGSMIIGLASVIIGVKVFKNLPLKDTTKVILGSIIYRGIIALAIMIGLSPNSMKLITAIIFLVILVISRKGEEDVRT
ncbi:ABC transporter permease [Lagierella sp.]|uniref:ABC transporter permease n=1 Tax=Lagierella sp. TaxID=2849657 RepID=UPI00261EDEA0|nr:ABC transporter permease [Lagierella sp.]